MSVIVPGFAAPGSYFPYYIYPGPAATVFDAQDTVNVSVIHNFFEPVLNLICSGNTTQPGYTHTLNGGNPDKLGFVLLGSVLIKLDQLGQLYNSVSKSITNYVQTAIQIHASVRQLLR